MQYPLILNNVEYAGC